MHFRKKAVTARRIQQYLPNGHTCIRPTVTRVSAKRTHVYPPNGHTCIRQTVTRVSARRSQTENNNNININPNRKESGSSLIRSVKMGTVPAFMLGKLRINRVLLSKAWAYNIFLLFFKYPLARRGKKMIYYAPVRPEQGSGRRSLKSGSWRLKRIAT